nr:head-tail connector protein [uncultured Acidaminococcus sp.]
MAVTGLITLEEAKAYLRIDGNEEDDLIARLIASSERLCLDILRKEEPEETAAFKMAVLFSVVYLYEHREDADYHNLLLTLRSLLFGERKEAF